MTSVPLLLARCAALPSTGCCSWAAVLRHGGCVPSVLNGHRSLAGSNLPAASAQAGPPPPLDVSGHVVICGHTLSTSAKGLHCDLAEARAHTRTPSQTGATSGNY